MSENKTPTTHFSNFTNYCFEKLLNAMLHKLEALHPGMLKNKISQVYGFGGYDIDSPSLKSELEKVSGVFVNGKYLYDKKRELTSGKPFIKLNRPYNHLVLDFLGYENTTAFLEEHISAEKEKKKQLALINAPGSSQTHYYVSYHFGEYKEVVKAEVTVKDNWKSIEFRYIYHQEDGTIKSFTYYGDIKKRADALHIQTRTFMDGKMVPGGENLLYIGYGDPAKSKYILGVFSAFDINNRLIAVKCILEKCSSKEEMQELVLLKKIPGYIALEIRNQRIENEINIPNDKLEISSNSPYYLTFERIAGCYKFKFDAQEHDLAELEIRIDPNTYKVSSLMPGLLINSNDIQILHNGSILSLKLKLSGLSPFLQLDIYVKTYYLNADVENISGIFCGIDFENRLINGQVLINFSPLV